MTRFQQHFCTAGAGGVDGNVVCGVDDEVDEAGAVVDVAGADTTDAAGADDEDDDIDTITMIITTTMSTATLTRTPMATFCPVPSSPPN